jgi:hypothetical protein
MNRTKKEEADNQRFYVALGVLAVLALACIGAFAYSVSYVTDNLNQQGPTATPLPPPVVSIQKIKALAELSTVEYSTVTEVYNETPPAGIVDKFLSNKEQLLMLVYGDVKAGFDLSRLTEDSLWTDGRRVRLALPPPEILNTSIDFERTHIVFYENKLLLDHNNPNLQGEALKQANEAIVKAALAEGVLDKSGEYGRIFFENFLYSMGFEDVEVTVNAQMFKE